MKKLYSIPQTYLILYNGIRSLTFLRKAEKNNDISKEFTERIMLAVTEVNECEICSYAHTKMALEMGMNEKEIQDMLSGQHEDVPAKEMPAILFAQHYADSKCKPSQGAWESIVETYGETKASGILATIRIITIGNTVGVPLGSFIGRFKGRPDKRSNIFYELGMMLSLLVFTPIVLVHSFIANIFNTKIIKFKSGDANNN